MTPDVEEKKLRTLRASLRRNSQVDPCRLLDPALERLSAGLTAPAVAKMVHPTPQGVRRVSHRYQRRRLPGALHVLQ